MRDNPREQFHAGGRRVSHETGHDFVFTSESVSEGHPDKVCDLIADSILDAHLAGDRNARVACEVLCKGRHVILAGEITSAATVDAKAVARDVIRRIGYTDPAEEFNADAVAIQELISVQAPEIGQAVGHGTEAAQGAGDQGLMFGYATDETPERMPLPILLAHRLSALLAKDRHEGRVGWLRPDAKTQVSVRYRDGRPVQVETVLVSTQHSDAVAQSEIEAFVREDLLPRALEAWYRKEINVIANPSGSFVLGGPSADAGVTGRKIIVDTYGGFARHGGGAFSGKDPSKVDRSGAYFCRWVARKIVDSGLARRAEVQVSYAIGRAKPVSTMVETFGTGDEVAAKRFVDQQDFSPANIAKQLDLLKPIYAMTTNYGHFGRPGLPWES
jgi:S-adenosylmethionine synthetase